MDMLYHRYACPFNFLQSLLDTGNLVQGFIHLFEKENDRKLWDLYLHSLPSESFDDWKEKVTSNQMTKELTKKEVETQVSKSNNILETFRI